VPEHESYGPKVLAPPIFSTTLSPDAVLPLAPLPISIEELRPSARFRRSPSVVLEALQTSAETVLANVLGATIIQLGSVAGARPKASVQLIDPQNSNNVIGGRLTILSVEAPPNRTIALEGTGLSPAQQGAHLAALAAGLRLTVRFPDVPLGGRPLEGGADGMSLLRADDFIGEEISALDSDEVVSVKRRGLRALELVDEVAIVAIPDINVQPKPVPPKDPKIPCEPDPCLPQQPTPVVTPAPPAARELPPIFSEEEIFLVQAALVQHCEDRRDRIALLDPPIAAARDDQFGVSAIRAWRTRFDSKYAALYYPWLRVVDPLRGAAGSLTRDIPPSGHVAGQFARTDIEVGVHKAPANDPLSWAEDVTVLVGDAIQGVLNPAGIDVVRPLPGRGLRIMGARTVSSDPSWRYVNVRRLMMMIEKAIDLSTQWAAFEPNDHYTRSKLNLALSSFLIALWQRGALAGNSIEEAFFVKCDESNNPPAERDLGRLIADVGVAPSNPFEFIVLRVGRTDNEFEIAEFALAAGGNR
jgi:hypothetical protein